MRIIARECDSLQNAKKQTQNPPTIAVVGVRPPLPAPTNSFICYTLQGGEVSKQDFFGTNTVQCASLLFSSICSAAPSSAVLLGFPSLTLYKYNICLITVCAADKVSAAVQPRFQFVVRIAIIKAKSLRSNSCTTGRTCRSMSFAVARQR
jgi:hypothetical protein